MVTQTPTSESSRKTMGDNSMSEAVKVYELAKELHLESFALIDKLKELGIEVKSHMSALDDAQVDIVKQHFNKGKAPAAPVAKTARRKAVAKPEEKKAAPTVIRRRAKSEEEALLQEEEMAAAAAEAEKQEEHSDAPVEASATSETTHEVTETSSTKTRRTLVITQKAPAQTTQETTKGKFTSSFNSNVSSGLRQSSLLGSRNAGQTVSKTSGLIKIIAEDPRPAIVKPKPGTTTEAPKVVSLGKEAIDKLVEDEQKFKKKAKGEKEDVVNVNIADYRAKKELVFLPKKKKLPVNKELKKTVITTPAAHKRVIKIEGQISVGELAQRMGAKSGAIIQKLMGQGVMATLNQLLDLDTATLLATEFGYEVENVEFNEESLFKNIVDKAEDMVTRPPIVTVMGHVDHGKTSLLDAIRQADVAAGEAGGITQHIGAYTVEIEGKPITFIDTPGHEAFTMMRARGANVTDLVILVVAADDGVMPQTREALDHARAANVPIIVAVNKIDKPNANPDKVTKGLSELNLLSEAWGGDTMFIPVSALKKTGIKELLEAILLQAEVLDLKANPNRAAEGVVLEAKLDRSKGTVANILVKKGSLKIGDLVVAGSAMGRVRALTDDKGKMLRIIGPGHAAELLGLEAVPTAGDTLNGTTDEAFAKKLSEHRQKKTQIKTASPSAKMTLEELFSKTQQGEMKELPVILKADVMGSSEAIKDSLLKIPSEKVKIKIIHTSTGGITESDVMLANASNAIILGFNVRPDTKARAFAETEKIQIKCYTIIYELLDDIKKAMAGLLDKKAVEQYLGRAEIRSTFSISKVGVIAGCGVIDGKILRNAQVRVVRDGRVLYTGKLASLKRFKDDAKEVAQGYECGMSVENYNDIKVGDILEAFQINMIEQTLESADEASKEKGAAKKSAGA